jgi:hypothetical protein
MRFIGYVNELRGDPDTIARPADAAFENRSYVEPFTDGRQALFLAAKRKCRCSSNHPQLLHLRKSVDNFFCQAVAEVLVLFVGA